MKADRYEREREKVRASKMPAHLKLARLFHIDMREERLLERRIKSDGKKLNALRDRVAKEREAREREQARAELRRTLHRSLSPSPSSLSSRLDSLFRFQLYPCFGHSLSQSLPHLPWRCSLKKVRLGL
jgi:hypothetical protein